MTENENPQDPQVFFEGSPIEPDINRLRDRWPEKELSPGDRITYQDAAEAIGEGVRTGRFYTVTTGWRRLVEELAGVVIDCDRHGQAFVVLDDLGKVGVSGRYIKGSRRKARRSLDVAAVTNPGNLDDAAQRRYFKVVEQGAKVLSVFKFRPKFSSADALKAIQAGTTKKQNGGNENG